MFQIRRESAPSKKRKSPPPPPTHIITIITTKNLITTVAGHTAKAAKDTKNNRPTTKMAKVAFANATRVPSVSFWGTCEILRRRKERRPRRPQQSRRSTLRIQKEANLGNQVKNNPQSPILLKKPEMYNNKSMCLYGYILRGWQFANPENKEYFIRSMTHSEYVVRPINMVCHDLCKKNLIPRAESLHLVYLSRRQSY